MLKKAKKKFRVIRTIPITPDNAPDLLEYYHPDQKICQIVPISETPKLDNFIEFRPEARLVADYTISQTNAKLDAGATKCYIRSTHANYKWLPDDQVIPLVEKPPKKPPKLEPKLKSIEELWREEQEIWQKYYHERFKIIQKVNREADKRKYGKQHEKLIAAIGPGWFIEMSPIQKRTVEFLMDCILLDLKHKTVINVFENLTYLGITAPLKTKDLKYALKECCKNTVEFLLIIYELIKQDQTQFTVSEKLLLSSVVHLTMPDTLLELHIRIPSPPRAPPIKKIIKKPKPKPVPISPYLQKNSFKPDPPKTGIYQNRHVQHPDHPYFCYRKKLELLRNSEEAGDEKSCINWRVDIRENEIKEELKIAQQIYQELVDFRPVPKLISPRIYPACKKTILKGPFDDDVPGPDVGYVLGGIRIAPDGSPIRVIEGSIKIPKPDFCNCFEIKTDDFLTICEEEKQEQENLCVCDENNVEPICPDIYQQNLLEEEDEAQQILDGKQQDLLKNICRCKEYIQKIINTPLCQCQRCIRDREKENNKFVITGLHQLASGACVKIIDSIKQQLSCNCLEKYKEKIQEFEEYVKRIHAVAQLQQKARNYIISGVMNTADGPVYVMNGITNLNKQKCKTCKCMEEDQRRKEAREQLLRQPHPPLGRKPFEIAGVAETSEGNVFILKSPLEVDDCKCAETYNDFVLKHTECLKLYEDYIKRMQEHLEEYANDLPPKKQKEVRVLMEKFEKIINPRRPTICDMLKEQASNNQNDGEIHKEGETIDSNVNGKLWATEDNRQIELQPDHGKEIDNNQCFEKKLGVQSAGESQNSRRKDSHGSKHSKMKQFDIRCKCLDDEPVECDDSCKCAEPELIPCSTECVCGEEIEQIEEEQEENQESKLKRIFIRNSIPVSVKEQKKLLKAALETLANDDFPLAKLPDCEKLPHFKLWLQLRSRKFWTLDDKKKYLKRATAKYRHILQCKVRKKQPSLPIDHTQVEHYTMAQLKTIRKMVANVKNAYLSEFKQGIINFGSEYYPLLYPYEFPSDRMTDCFFAYTPSKESDIIAEFLWQLHELKDLSHRVSCLRR